MTHRNVSVKKTLITYKIESMFVYISLNVACMSRGQVARYIEFEHYVILSSILSCILYLFYI